MIAVCMGGRGSSVCPGMAVGAGAGVEQFGMCGEARADHLALPAGGVRRFLFLALFAWVQMSQRHPQFW